VLLGVILKLMFERVAALDLAKASLTACVRACAVGSAVRRRSQVRTFDTTVGGPLLLRDWLPAEQVQVVVMESTDVYWKPAYYLLDTLSVGNRGPPTLSGVCVVGGWHGRLVAQRNFWVTGDLGREPSYRSSLAQAAGAPQRTRLVTPQRASTRACLLSGEPDDDAA